MYGWKFPIIGFVFIVNVNVICIVNNVHPWRYCFLLWGFVFEYYYDWNFFDNSLFLFNLIILLCVSLLYFLNLSFAQSFGSFKGWPPDIGSIVWMNVLV